MESADARSAKPPGGYLEGAEVAASHTVNPDPFTARNSVYSLLMDLIREFL